MTEQLLHLVFGGRVKDPSGTEFISTDNLHIVGIYPNYKQAQEAWRSAAQSSIDDAMMKYVIVHLHRLMEPHPNGHEA